MERYLEFDNKESLERYVFNMGCIKLGEGSEGLAYRTRDNNIVKISNGVFRNAIDASKKDEIIMKQDFDLESFMFPKQLFISEGVIAGYIADFFPKDLFRFGKIDFTFGSIKDLNINNFTKAREKFIKDAMVLTDAKILLYDLPFNILYDKHKLAAIDTLGYYKDDTISLDEQIKRIDYALLSEIGLYAMDFNPDFDQSYEQNLKRIRTI